MFKYLNKKHYVSSLFLFVILGCTFIIISSLLIFLLWAESPDNQILLYIVLLTSLILLLVLGVIVFQQARPAPLHVIEESRQEIATKPEVNLTKDLQNEKNYFASVLSHDLRSPLSSIVLLASYLKSKDENAESNQYIELIEQSARKELDMMSALLSLMRPHSYRTESFEELKLHGLVKEIMQGEEARLTKKKLDVDLDIPEDLTLFADPQVFKAILRNLIVQAICYSDQSQTIQIITKGVDDRMLIELVIISEELRKAVAEDLFNSDRLLTKASKNEFPECIDLYFCQQAIHNYNGTIHVQVENNLSCRFIISLERFPERNTL